MADNECEAEVAQRHRIVGNDVVGLAQEIVALELQAQVIPS